MLNYIFLIISSRRNDYCFLSREAIEAFTGVLPTVYVASNCRCPPTHPKINVAEPAKCLKNLDGDTDTVSRLNDTAHPTEFATDGDSLSYWLSEITENATIHINLAYAGLQVGFFNSECYLLPRKTIQEESVHQYC